MKGKLLAITGFILSIFMSVNAQSESANVPPEWKTLAEQTDYHKTWNYAETIAFAQKLDKASDNVLYKSFGKSGEGRDLPLLIVSDSKITTPEKAKKSGKAIILIQAGIHSGEIDGKDAGFALIRDIVITKTRANLLKENILLFVPIYNVDGHEMSSPYNRINQNGPDEMGWRATSAGLNLNRDYMKADAPETRAFLKLWNDWKPDFFFDLHVTDGADFQYNVTYEYAHFGEVSPFVKNWMDAHFDVKIKAEVEKQGNLLTHYLEFGGREVTSGIFTFIATPRYATGYAALRNRPGLLIETHSLKPYKSRVRGTYDVLWKTLEEINTSKASLFEANRKADEETVNRGKTYDANRQFPLQIGLTDKSEPFNLKAVEYKFEDSAISGGKKLVYGTKPLDVTVKKYDEGKVNASAAPPRFYIIPPQCSEVIERLEAHGIKFERMKNEFGIEVESYRLTEPKWAQNPFENRVPVSFKITPITEVRTFPANSVLVPLDQEAANVAIHLLEPASNDSFVYWGFFNSIFEMKEYFSDYIMEKIAAEMLAKDENLRKEFEEKLKDETFAKSARARLQFFYQRSPYADKRIGVYPVGRITKEFRK
ncbi:MAG TPA: M14 family metallopeptidase [Pyrinomonadaceae bacterium]|nr:M14 family metallopeptidase [Pyrinomonadaceae bacterium]